jgi:hypothetical protein
MHALFVSQGLISLQQRDKSAPDRRGHPPVVVPSSAKALRHFLV